MPRDYLVWLCESGTIQSGFYYDEVVRILGYRPERKPEAKRNGYQGKSNIRFEPKGTKTKPGQKKKHAMKEARDAKKQEKKEAGLLLYQGGPPVPAATQPPPDTVFHSDRDVPPWE